MLIIANCSVGFRTTLSRFNQTAMTTRKVLFLDTDIQVSPEILEKLISSMRPAEGKPIAIFTNLKCKLLRTVNLNNLSLHLGVARRCAVLEQQTFNADRICSIFGSLTSDGILIVITPIPIQLKNYFAIYTQSEIFEILTVSDALNTPTLLSRFFNNINAAPFSHPGTATPQLDPDQNRFISMVVSLMKNGREFTVHLDGERGSGKTTATLRLVDTLVHNMFRCGMYNAGSRDLTSRYTDIPGLSVITDDNACEYVDSIDLLIIEEAAALPVAVLESLLKKYGRTVLVTTDSGYEGSAMGLRHHLYDRFGIISLHLHGHYRNLHDTAAEILDAIFFNSPVNHRVIKNNGRDILPAQTKNNITTSKEIIHCRKISLDPDNNRIIVSASGAELLNTNAGRHILYLINRLLRTNHYEQTPQDLIRWLIQEETSLTFMFIGKNPHDTCDTGRNNPDHEVTNYDKSLNSVSSDNNDCNSLYINRKDIPAPVTETALFVEDNLPENCFLLDFGTDDNVYFSKISTDKSGSWPECRNQLNCQEMSAMALSRFRTGEHMTLAGVTISTEEGHIEKTLAHDIMMGTRQPRNNLCPQTLITQCGIEDAGNFGYLRIERIAVIPQFRRTAVATGMIRHLQNAAPAFNYDFLGVSFALSTGTTKFWLSNGFVPVNVGLTPDNASGRRSLLMLWESDSPCNENKAFNARQAFQLFKKKLPHLIIPFGLEHDSAVFVDINVRGISELFNSDVALNYKNDVTPCKNSPLSECDRIPGVELSDDLSESVASDADRLPTKGDLFLKKQYVGTINSIINGHHSLVHSIYELKLMFSSSPYVHKLTDEEKDAFRLFLTFGMTKKKELQHLLKTDGAKSTLKQLRNIVRKMG